MFNVIYVKKFVEVFKLILRNRLWKVKLKVVCLFVIVIIWLFLEKGEWDLNGLKEFKWNGSVE